MPLNESAVFLKERLVSIMRFQKRPKRIIALSLLFVLVFIFGATVSGAYSAPSKEDTNTEQAAPANTPQNLQKEYIPKADESNNYGAGKNNPYIHTNASGKITSYFCVNFYYQEPYLLEIGWNVRENDKDSYASQSVLLPNGDSMTVFFEKNCENIVQNTSVMQILPELLSQIQAVKQDTDFPFICPLLLSFEDTTGSSPQDLAALYYQENDPSRFAAVIAALSETMQFNYLEKAVIDENVSIVSICLEQLLRQNSLPDIQKTLKPYLEIAYQNYDIAFFSICLDYLEPDKPLVEQYLEKAYQDYQIDFFSVLLNHLEEDRPLIAQYANRAYEDDNLSFFSILTNSMDDTLLETWYQKAAKDRNTKFLLVLSNCMENE